MAICALALLGCGAGSDGWTVEDIGSGLPRGEIGGASWAMVEASVNVDGGDLDVELYAEDVDECAFVPSSSLPHVMFTVPNAVGEYPLYFEGLTSGRTATLYEPATSMNNIATEGIIHVVATSAGEVTIGLVADAGESIVNGTFVAPICAGDGA